MASASSRKQADNDDNDETVSVMVRCDRCGHLVPENNMPLHVATACGGGRRRRTTHHNRDDDNTISNNDERISVTATTTNNRATDLSHRLIAGQHSDNNSSSRDASNIATSNNLIDLTSSPAATNSNQNDSRSSSREEEGISNDEWTCPRCTLLNRLSDHRCQACSYQNNEITREADATRRERLINDDDDTLFGLQCGSTAFESSPYSFSSTLQSQQMGNDIGNSTAPSSPVTTAATTTTGGALFGALLGGAGAYIRGRSVSNGIMEGAMTGAVGGAVGGALMDMQQRRNSTTTNDDSDNNASASTNVSPVVQQQGIAAARSSGVMGVPGYPSVSGDSNLRVTGSSGNAQRARPRRSVRVVRHSGGGGFSTTIAFSDGQTQHIDRADDLGDPMLNLMMHSMLTDSGLGGAEFGSRRSHRLLRHSIAGSQPNGAFIDGMSYEQMLEAFGDGTENLGADEGEIQTLPTATIKNINKELPTDELKQCCVCLESFVNGDQRKTLPCLHGFHQSCIDKWLKTNGSCPICKHRISSSSP